MREAGKVASKILSELKGIIQKGSTGIDINHFAENFIKQYYPNFNLSTKGYQGFPASLCVSINEEIVHGIPSQRIIQNGDLVTVDIVVDHQGWFADTARTYTVGNVSPQSKKLIEVTQNALFKAINAAKVGNTIGDLGYLIEDCATQEGFSVIKEFGGHGIGREMHMDPFIPNFGRQGEGLRLEEGMTLAIETMFFAGKSDITVADNGWTVKSKDNSMTAHFEHTVLITKNQPVIFTDE